MTKSKQYWLFKSEPETFSIADLERSPKKTTCWDGVRNYQARNFLRDTVKVGDGVLFYHSSSEPPGIVGLAEVVKAGYPDYTAFAPGDPHFDPKSDAKNPTWFMVDIKHLKTFSQAIPLSELKAIKSLEKMVLLQKGSRLSVQPVKEKEWQAIIKLSDN
jgi:predicted RNA-binding protein with PUA-like domain